MDRKFWRWILYRWLIVSLGVVTIYSVQFTILLYLDYINHISRDVKTLFLSAFIPYISIWIFIIGLFLFFMRYIFIEPRMLNHNKMRRFLKDSTKMENIRYWFCWCFGIFYIVAICELIVDILVYFAALHYVRFYICSVIFIILCLLATLVRHKITQGMSFLQERIVQKS